MKIYLGADHRGFELKEKIARWLFDWKYKFEDLGALTLDPNDDYTKYAALVASMVAKEKDSRGILLCGSGVGVDITANKFDGVRSSLGKNANQVKAGRADDNMNILVIAADYTKDEEAIKMIKAFLETNFNRTVRYTKRIEEITKIEANN